MQGLERQLEGVIPILLKLRRVAETWQFNEEDELECLESVRDSLLKFLKSLDEFLIEPNLLRKFISNTGSNTPMTIFLRTMKTTCFLGLEKKLKLFIREENLEQFDRIINVQSGERTTTIIEDEIDQRDNSNIPRISPPGENREMSNFISPIKSTFPSKPLGQVKQFFVRRGRFSC